MQELQCLGDPHRTKQLWNIAHNTAKTGIAILSDVRMRITRIRMRIKRLDIDLATVVDS